MGTSSPVRAIPPLRNSPVRCPPTPDRSRRPSRGGARVRTLSPSTDRIQARYLTAEELALQRSGGTASAGQGRRLGTFGMALAAATVAHGGRRPCRNLIVRRARTTIEGDHPVIEPAIASTVSAELMRSVVTSADRERRDQGRACTERPAEARWKAVARRWFVGYRG